MEFTGERFIPYATDDYDISAEHFHRYNAIKNIVANKTVVDIASGEGYGSAIQIIS